MPRQPTAEQRHEREMLVWNTRLVGKLALVLAVCAAVFAAGLAMTVLGLTPSLVEGLLLPGLILAAAALVFSLVASVASFFCQAKLERVSAWARWATFLGLVAGLGVPNVVLGVLGWFGMRRIARGLA